MAKTAPVKKGSTSVRSRAAKRASSPSIDTDKSLKNVPPVETKTARPSVLAIHQGAGVSKKSKNGRKAVLSAKAKRRQEKGMDRAEAVMDKKETKVEKSKGRARTVQERAKAWEDLNKKMLLKKAADAQALKDAQKTQSDDESEDVEEEAQVDEEVSMEMDDENYVEPTGGMKNSLWAPKPPPAFVPLPEDDEEEL